jgi:hypothetical protein
MSCTSTSARQAWEGPGNLHLAHPPGDWSARAESTRDSDGDGVYDFDEINRFHTNPNNTDSDADGVRLSGHRDRRVYEDESRLGYAWNELTALAGTDADGKPTELDPDSDNGGCKDGEEDVSYDGYREDPEKGNFNQGDDECGSLRGNVSWSIDMVNTDPNEIAKAIHESGVILVRLKPESPGSDSYVDDSSTFNFRRTGRIEVNLGDCILVGRGTATGAGPFLTNAEIGATRGDDGTLAFSAEAEVSGRNFTSGCGRPPASGPESRSMGFPDCTGKLDPKSAKGVRTYRFNCTTAPVPPGSGWKVNRTFGGFIRLEGGQATRSSSGRAHPLAGNFDAGFPQTAPATGLAARTPPTTPRSRTSRVVRRVSVLPGLDHSAVMHGCAIPTPEEIKRLR